MGNRGEDKMDEENSTITMQDLIDCVVEQSMQKPVEKSTYIRSSEVMFLKMFNGERSWNINAENVPANRSHDPKNLYVNCSEYQSRLENLNALNNLLMSMETNGNGGSAGGGAGGSVHPNGKSTQSGDNSSIINQMKNKITQIEKNAAQKQHTPMPPQSSLLSLSPSNVSTKTTSRNYPPKTMTPVSSNHKLHSKNVLNKNTLSAPDLNRKDFLTPDPPSNQNSQSAFHLNKNSLTPSTLSPLGATSSEPSPDIAAVSDSISSDSSLYEHCHGLKITDTAAARAGPDSVAHLPALGNCDVGETKMMSGDLPSSCCGDTRESEAAASGTSCNSNRDSEGCNEEMNDVVSFSPMSRSVPPGPPPPLVTLSQANEYNSEEMLSCGPILSTDFSHNTSSPHTSPITIGSCSTHRHPKKQIYDRHLRETSKTENKAPSTPNSSTKSNNFNSRSPPLSPGAAADSANISHPQFAPSFDEHNFKINNDPIHEQQSYRAAPPLPPSLLIAQPSPQQQQHIHPQFLDQGHLEDRFFAPTLNNYVQLLSNQIPTALNSEDFLLAASSSSPCLRPRPVSHFVPLLRPSNDMEVSNHLINAYNQNLPPPTHGRYYGAHNITGLVSNSRGLHTNDYINHSLYSLYSGELGFVGGHGGGVDISRHHVPPPSFSSMDSLHRSQFKMRPNVSQFPPRK